MVIPLSIGNYSWAVGFLPGFIETVYATVICSHYLIVDETKMLLLMTPKCFNLNTNRRRKKHNWCERFPSTVCRFSAQRFGHAKLELVGEDAELGGRPHITSAMQVRHVGMLLDSMCGAAANPDCSHVSAAVVGRSGAAAAAAMSRARRPTRSDRPTDRSTRCPSKCVRRGRAGARSDHPGRPHRSAQWSRRNRLPFVGQGPRMNAAAAAAGLAI